MSAFALLKSEQSPAFERPTLTSIDHRDLAGLQHKLNNTTPRADAYSQSAAYYAMTGRKGLWLYSNHDSFMLIAQHPNSQNHLLLFPPLGKNPAKLLLHCLQDKRICANKIQLARFSDQDKVCLSLAKACGSFKTAPEDLLDWKYPIHTLSTKAVAKHQGRSFRNFRHGLNLADAAGLSVTIINIRKDKSIILKLVKSWAETNIHEGYSQEDLIAPTHATLDMMEKTYLPLHGVIIHKESQPIGFMTWEETNSRAGIASSMCGMSIEEKGVTEFIYHSMAQIVAKRGFGTLCIGGSETAGLDAFKRKMNPIHSVALDSAFTTRNVKTLPHHHAQYRVLRGLEHSTTTPCVKNAYD